MFPFITALVPHWFYHVCFGLKSASPTKVIRLSGGILICWHPRIQASSYFYINWHKEGKNPLELGILQRVNKKDRKANHNCLSLCIRQKLLNKCICTHIHTGLLSNAQLPCDKWSCVSSGPPTQQGNQNMHLEMVRATNTTKRFMITVGYYWGPWPTPEPDRGGDREHCNLGEHGWTTYITRREELLT